MTQTQLFKVTCQSVKSKFFLSAYASTIVYAPISRNENGPVKGRLIAIHFGGEPSTVQALCTLIIGGTALQADTPDGSLELIPQKAKYQKTFTGSNGYAEALISLEKEEKIEREEKKDARGESYFVTHIKERRFYLYTPIGDDDRLFQMIDKRSNMPLLPEFQDYLLDEARLRGILTPLAALSCTESFAAWQLALNENEQNLHEVLDDGLRAGKIRVPGADAHSPDAFKDIETISQYLAKFGVTIAERIKDRYQPLFDPSKEPFSPEVNRINDHIFQNTAYHLYDAQLAAAEAASRKIDQNRPAIIVGDCGSGKTKIGMTALAASQMREAQKKHFNIVMCPSHLCRKWARENMETVPNSRAAIVHTIPELKAVYQDYLDGGKTVYAVISKEHARNGYFRGPAVRWVKSKKGFVCPDCGKVIEMPLVDEGGSTYFVHADGTFFLRENSKNHMCAHCKSPLWAPACGGALPNGWVKVGGFGYVYLPQRTHYIPLIKNSSVCKKLEDLAESRIPQRSASPRRYPLSTYIRKKMRGRIDALIADELHQYNNDSGQGDAMGEIASTARKVVGMTATLINGYATGIFYLLYRLFPYYMQLDDKAYGDTKAFASDYGVVESTFEISEEEYQSARRTVVRKKKDRLLPGVSPLVYARFLMENAVFISLYDMGKALPDYEEIPIGLTMNNDVAEEYRHIQKYFQALSRSDPKKASVLQSAFINLLTVYPDQPYGHDPIFFSEKGGPAQVVYEPQAAAQPGSPLEKDRKVLELVRTKLDAGENVLIYTSWVRLDTQEKLFKALRENDIPAAVMTQTVPVERREDWVQAQLDKGIRVLIVNPSLLETGLDLNAFTTLIYYNISYNLFTLRQSSRRSWRINQTAPRIEVYFFYYSNTIQQRAIELMATKLSVATLIEGNISDEGLAALGSNDDLASQLAKELAQGISEHIEDLTSMFHKMAFLKEQKAGNEQIQASAPPEYHNTGASLSVRELPISAPTGITERTQEPLAETPTIRYAFTVSKLSHKKPGTGQPLKQPSQLSLFELFGQSA